MRNPFQDLGKPRLNDDDGEDFSESSFACQEFGCYEPCTNAKYNPDTGLLKWVCGDGHISQIKNFRIDF